MDRGIQGGGLGTRQTCRQFAVLVDGLVRIERLDDRGRAILRLSQRWLLALVSVGRAFGTGIPKNFLTKFSS